MTDRETAIFEQAMEDMRGQQGPFAVYSNPWRDDDSVFINQNIPIEPYHSLGGFVYPAVPQGGSGLGYGVPRVVGERLVAELNALMEGVQQ